MNFRVWYANHSLRAHKTVCENRYAVWILVKISICLPWYLLYGSCRYPRVLYSSIATRRRDPRARRQISILPCGTTLFLLWRYRRCHIFVLLKICCQWKKIHKRLVSVTSDYTCAISAQPTFSFLWWPFLWYWWEQLSVRVWNVDIIL